MYGLEYEPRNSKEKWLLGLACWGPLLWLRSSGGNTLRCDDDECYRDVTPTTKAADTMAEGLTVEGWCPVSISKATILPRLAFSPLHPSRAANPMLCGAIAQGCAVCSPLAR